MFTDFFMVELKEDMILIRALRKVQKKGEGSYTTSSN